MRDYRDAFPGLRSPPFSLVHELGSLTDRIKCAVCGELCESTLRDTQDERPERVFLLEMRCHGTVERREITARQISRPYNPGLTDFLATAFQQQARFRNRKDPGMLRFRRRRASGARSVAWVSYGNPGVQS